MRRNRLTALLSVVAVGGIFLMSSCLKNDNNNSSQQPKSVISVLHAAPGVSGLDLYLNGTKSNSSIINYKDYLAGPVESATYDIKFVRPSGDTLISVVDSVSAGQYYSAIVYDTGSAVSLMFFEDQFGQAQNQSDAFLRFLDLKPGNETVSIHTVDDIIFNSRHFADNLPGQDPSLAKFQPFSSGTYSFTAIDGNGDTIARAENQDLSSGGAYTLYLHGITGSPTDSLRPELTLTRTY